MWDRPKGHPILDKQTAEFKWQHSEPYGPVSPDVVKAFQNLDPKNLDMVREFLRAYGPLTEPKKDGKFYIVNPDAFEKDWLMLSGSIKAEIRLTGKPGGSPVFAPASLLDYIYLASCKELSSRLCANPRCDKPLQRPNQKYCSTRGPGNCRNQFVTLMNRVSLDVFGVSWREANKTDKKVIEIGFGDVAKSDDFEVIKE